VGASLFASNIGSGHFVGLAGSGAASGIGIAGFELNADLFAGAIFIKQALGWNLYLSVCALLIVACLFTVAGLVEVGGYDQLMKAFATAEPTNASYARYTATNESCSRVPDNYNHLLRSPLDSELPWTGMVFGSVVCAIWYWCSDQVIVQRALSAKNMVHAKAGCVMAGYLKLLPMYLLVIPGMAARVLFPGARGMMLSVMLAALMSSLTSIFNSSSTIFTIDIWKKFRKNASEMELLIVGRTFVVVLVGVSIIWIPIIEVFPSSQLFHYIQGVTSYLAPPVCAVYVLAVSWKRINEPGAFWGLMIGLAVGMSRFIWEFSYHVPGCGSPDPDPRPAIISSVHYLHFALHRLTYATRKSTEIREDLDRPRLKSVSQVNGVYNGTDNVSYTKSSENLTNDIPMTTLRHSSPHESIRPTHKEHCLHLFRRVTEVSGLKRALFCICGVTSTQQKAEAEAANPLPRLSPAEEALEAARSLEEHPLWGKVCNVNAVVLLVVASFVLGFYA
ncbi:hypothetical protein HPB47_009014, partial [Ixodes persulcatus]